MTARGDAAGWRYGAATREEAARRWREEQDRRGSRTTADRIHDREVQAMVGGPSALRQCPECDRVFNMAFEEDAAEWTYGHDCEA